MGNFIDEVRAYELMKSVGLRVPRHSLILGPSNLAELPFETGEAVVLKGVVKGVWHKSDLGLVRFGSYDPRWVQGIADDMRRSSANHGEWKGMLVVERVVQRGAPGLSGEGLVALRRSPETGWVVLAGMGGLHANAWAREIPPLLWPVNFTDPLVALKEWREHPLGRVWLGLVRQGEALTTEAHFQDFLVRLWRLVEVLEAQGIGLLEMNPVVIDVEGNPVALDGVGEEWIPSDLSHGKHSLPPEVLHRLLVEPASVAVVGISSHEASPGRVILENLQRSSLNPSRILPIKPGEQQILGLPCLQSVEELRERPADQLILSLPAPKAIRMIEQLCEQGGGAEVVYLVPGGLGDGADQAGRGARLETLLSERREKGLWTPVLVGPNGVGFLSSEGHLNSLFIPRQKLPFEARGGPLALLSQSGAFLLTCLSKGPHLPLRYGISIGNQLDLRLSDFLRALACDRQVRVIACYVEGFRPGDLQEVARAAQELDRQGKRVLLYKGGRSEAGQVAASSHTGALAGDWKLQQEVLRRAGVILASSIDAFDAAMTWLAAHPGGKPSRLAVITNAGYEAVASADLLGERLTSYALEKGEQEDLQLCLDGHGLQDLVTPHLPLDLTPMAGERAFLDCLRLLAASAADSLVVGLVPFTQYLETSDESRMTAFAASLAAVARESGKRLGVSVDSGTEFEAFRQSLMKAGLPVFPSMERALYGLRLLAQ